VNYLLCWVRRVQAKQHILRIVAGLEKADSGRVMLEGRDVTEEDPRDRGIGFVFQHYALFGI
jgi:sulfate transport system ATP-binding protein